MQAREVKKTTSGTAGDLQSRKPHGCNTRANSNHVRGHTTEQ